MAQVTKEQLKEVIENFQYNGEVLASKAFGSGHINDTFLLTLDTEEKIVLQRLNRSVFLKLEELMENVMKVTSHVRNKVIEAGGNPTRETINIVLAKNGKPYYIDSKKDFWRTYIYVGDASCYDRVENPEHFYQSGVAFGNFQKQLSDYPAETLHETIEGFHDTKARFAVFKKAVEEDVMGRAASVQEEIKFVLKREDVANYFTELLEAGELPLRVTHNDTKLNNVLIDNATGKGICVLDLDTVMPGLAMHDFGDAIRFGASTAAEDEKDLSKVSCSMELFELFTKGFIEGCAGGLTEREIELLPMGAKSMTYECGMRFLTDYLQGDTYFKVHREGHNLDRCRTQFKLVKDMEEKWEIMQSIVRKYSK